jgi:SAM-dependent methyltransferase
MTSKKKVNLPYFDHLLDALNKKDAEVERSFGRHVHWGYWQRPEQAQHTADDFAAAAENLTREICLSANITDNQHILDAGCGFGGTVAYVNENYSDMVLYGLNLDNRQLLRAKKRIQAIGSNQVHFHQGDACRLPYPDHSFDVVLAVECIFHFPDRHIFFQEVKRVLNPGGVLAISDFVPVSMLLPLTKFSWPEPYKIGFYGLTGEPSGHRIPLLCQA